MDFPNKMSKKLRTRWQNFLLRASFCPIWGTKMVLFWFCVVTFLSRRCVISVSGLVRLQLRVGNKKRRRRTFALCSISLSSPLFVCLPSVSCPVQKSQDGQMGYPCCSFSRAVRRSATMKVLPPMNITSSGRAAVCAAA